MPYHLFPVPAMICVVGAIALFPKLVTCCADVVVEQEKLIRFVLPKLQQVWIRVMVIERGLYSDLLAVGAKLISGHLYGKVMRLMISAVV